MSLRQDCQGLESLPLKLMIVAIVASLSVLPAAKALESLRNREFLQRADSQLERIASAAQTLLIVGPGNVRTLSIDLRSGGSISFHDLRIGGAKGDPNESALVLTLSTGARMAKAIQDPPVRMSSPEGTAVEVASPEFSLRLTSIVGGTDCIVMVEVV